MAKTRDRNDEPQTIDHENSAGPGGPSVEPMDEAAIQPTDDQAMPTVENDPDFVFRPQPGCSVLDVFEIALMYLLQLTNSSVEVAPGTLRGVPLSAHRTNQLSEQARKHLFPSRAMASQNPEG